VIRPIGHDPQQRTHQNNSVLHFGALHGRSRYQAAKSLAQDPSIIIFDEPTRGVDVGTIPEIHAEIPSLADEGKAVVVISSYLPEVLAVSDRDRAAGKGWSSRSSRPTSWTTKSA
jgi:ABC-type sugar transport system ATPase subunit